MVLVDFTRQEDPRRELKTHIARKELNKMWQNDRTRTDASQGFHKDIVSTTRLNLRTSADVVESGDAHWTGSSLDTHWTKRSNKNSRDKNEKEKFHTLARVLAASSESESLASTHIASNSRRRATSAVCHSATKLNEALANQWNKELTQRSKTAADLEQVTVITRLLHEAQHMDSTSTTALEQAKRTITKMSKRPSSRGSGRKIKKEEDPKSEARNSAVTSGDDVRIVERDVPLKQNEPEKSHVTGQARDTLRPALQHSALHKVRELEGKARVWDMSGGLHMSGTKRDVRSPFLEPKRKRHDPTGLYSNSMRPQTACPGTEVRRFGSERPSFFTVDGETKKAEQPSFFTVGGEIGSLNQSNKQPEQVMGGNSLCTLRYPSGAPETAPHRGEGFREDVHFMGSHWNFRFKDRRKHTSGYEYGNLPRPTSAFPDLLPITQPKDNAKIGNGIATPIHPPDRSPPNSTVTWDGDIQSQQATDRKATDRNALSPQLDAQSDINKGALQQATVMSISVGNDNGEKNKSDTTRIEGSESMVSSVGNMVWGTLDGERISPRQFHRRRTDLTSRMQIRMGYGINNKSKVLAETLSSSPPRVRGLKTLQEKRLKQKELADDIAAATKLSRPKTPPDTTTSILSTALPMNRPSQNNWAFQTIYLPKTMSNWHPGNVTKVHQVRKSPGHFDDIDYATAAKLFTRATVITPWV